MFLTLSPAFAEKPVLVLFPIEVGEADAANEADFGTALQEGLQSRYEVFYGPAVEVELEKEYQKVDCNAERCQQNVAIAFNGELVADASARRVGTGYVLKFVVSNVITGKLVESKSYPCRGCDVFAVIDAFKVIGKADEVKKNLSAAELYELGLDYTLGRKGKVQNYSEAVKYFTEAAEQGHARAQYSLGNRYKSGQGVAQDDVKAVYWYRKAAEQGHASAQKALKKMGL